MKKIPCPRMDGGDKRTLCATILSSNTTISELRYFKWPKWPLIYRRKSIYYCDMLNLLSKPCVISANFENGTVTEDSKCTSINFFYELLKFLWLTIGLTFQIVAQKMEKWDYISPRSPKIHWRPFRFLRRRFIFLYAFYAVKSCQIWLKL